MDLLRDVPLETEPLGNAERLRELPSREVRAADVPDLARVDERVERVERLLDRRLAVPLVHLVKVNVVDAESPKARLTSPNEVVTRESRFVRTVTSGEACLRRNEETVPPTSDRLTDELLRSAAGVDVGGVDEVDAGAECQVDLAARLACGRRAEHPF